MKLSNVSLFSITEREKSNSILAEKAIIPTLDSVRSSYSKTCDNFVNISLILLLLITITIKIIELTIQSQHKRDVHKLYNNRYNNENKYNLKDVSNAIVWVYHFFKNLKKQDPNIRIILKITEPKYYVPNNQINLTSHLFELSRVSKTLKNYLSNLAQNQEVYEQFENGCKECQNVSHEIRILICSLFNVNEKVLPYFHIKRIELKAIPLCLLSSQQSHINVNDQLIVENNLQEYNSMYLISFSIEINEVRIEKDILKSIISYLLRKEGLKEDKTYDFISLVTDIVFQIGNFRNEYKANDLFQSLCSQNLEEKTIVKPGLWYGIVNFFKEDKDRQIF